MVLRFREPANGLTHAVGLVLSVLGLVLLLSKAVGVWQVVTFTVFGVSLILMYLASTLYHWLPLAPGGVLKMRKLDHSMVFFLIAGTYTPIVLLGLGGRWGWSIFGVVWGIAVAGVLFKLFWMNAPRYLSTAIYILMGWVIMVAIWPLIQALELEAFLWLAAGGLMYTVGAVVYAMKRPDPLPGFLGFHEIFHLFCILGSLCHFWVIYGYLAGA